MAKVVYSPRGRTGEGAVGVGASVTITDPRVPAGADKSVAVSDGEGACKIGYRWAPGVHSADGVVAKLPLEFDKDGCSEWLPGAGDQEAANSLKLWRRPFPQRVRECGKSVCVCVCAYNGLHKGGAQLARGQVVFKSANPYSSYSNCILSEGWAKRPPLPAPPATTWGGESWDMGCPEGFQGLGKGFGSVCVAGRLKLVEITGETYNYKS